jgi:hypothetical protein
LPIAGQSSVLRGRGKVSVFESVAAARHHLGAQPSARTLDLSHFRVI